MPEKGGHQGRRGNLDLALFHRLARWSLSWYFAPSWCPAMRDCTINVLLALVIGPAGDVALGANAEALTDVSASAGEPAMIEAKVVSRLPMEAQEQRVTSLIQSLLVAACLGGHPALFIKCVVCPACLSQDSQACMLLT